MTYEKEKQIERRVCVEMLREAFFKLRLTEQFTQIHHKELSTTSLKWKNLLDRMKANTFFYVSDVRCIVPLNIVTYIQNIEEIRQVLLEEYSKRKLQELK